MREIKFRGWNGKEMLPYRHWFTLHHNFTLCFEADVELMQYTGTQDRKGTDIYEGDIINNHRNGKTGDIAVITYGSWDEGDQIQVYGFYAKDISGGFAYWNPEDMKVEVIGNIWETPELLK